MASGGRVPPPPRDLNVLSFAQSRAPELQSLHAIVAARTGHDYRIPRGKRRRTTSFDSRKRRGRKRRKVEGTGEGNRAEERRPSRRLRRRAEFQGNPELGFVESADGTRRLRTHLWHAKRFTMVKRWGFFLPLGLHGKGRGSRALLRWLKTGTAIHDASYYCPIQLEGSEDSLLAVMRSVLIPSPTDLSDKQSRAIIAGAKYGNALLHHVGASNSRFIAPVIYMWRPSLKDNANVEVEVDRDSNDCMISENNNGSNAPSRQTWIWLHAAAFHEGFDVLRSACLKKAEDSGDSIHCTSLEGEVVKFEIMGHTATETLMKLLHPAQEPRSTTDPVLPSFSNLKNKSSFILENIMGAPSHAILSLKVHDPRDVLGEKMKDVSPSPPIIVEDSKREDSVQHDLCSTNEAIPFLWSNIEDGDNSLADNEDLWSARDGISPPRKENILCFEKHNRRLVQFYMNKVNTESSQDACEESTCHSCPVLLLRHDDLKSAQWWSIILPLKWAKAFWIPIVSYGAHATGQRERQWIASDNGLPSYPLDFPDCMAYSVMMASEAAASDKAAELRPYFMRPHRIPIPSPWNCLRCSVQKDNQTCTFNLKDNKQLDPNVEFVGGVSESASGSYYSASPGDNSILSHSVLRTHLHCHPKTTINDSTFTISETVARTEPRDLLETNWISNIDTSVSVDGRLCLMRVLLCSFKEGHFKQGAVVCAPTLDDILLWTSRDVEQRNLQIPQSQPYFQERKPGLWELQVPTDPSLCPWFRWPIGFVTTGFVIGSPKPVAEAFCEATLLAKLRRQQEDTMPEKLRSKIFVLVRNLTSTAYRLALADIVLEKQKEDLDFM